MNTSSFLMGIIFGMIIATTFFVLNWKYLKAKAQEGRKQQVITQSEKPVVTISVTVISETDTPYMSGVRFDLPISWERMVQLARRVVNQNFKYDYSLTGLSAGNPLTRGEYDRLTPILIENGLLRERVPGNTRSGNELTGPGRALMRKWCDLPPLKDDELVKYSPEFSAQTHENTRTTREWTRR